jgi:hypothetical protein
MNIIAIMEVWALKSDAESTQMPRERAWVDNGSRQDPEF